MKKGDRVLVWSLQSFSQGGFLCAEPAFLRQSSNSVNSKNNSVILCVIRNFDGEYKIDTSYEVYIKQIEKVEKKDWKAKKELKKFRKEIMQTATIF